MNLKLLHPALWCIVFIMLGYQKVSPRPSHVAHMAHIVTLFQAKLESQQPIPQAPALTSPHQSNTQQPIQSALLSLTNAGFTTQNNPQPLQNTPANSYEEDRLHANTIATAFTPLLTHYSFEKIIPRDPATTALDEQLEYIQMISKFIGELGKKYEDLPEKVRIFMNTPSGSDQPIVNLITQTLVCLKIFFAERLEAYKKITTQTPLLKKLKKIGTETAKQIDTLCQKILHLGPQDI